MAKARYTTDDYACDALERPVRYNGFHCIVLDYDGTFGPGGEVTIRAYGGGDRQHDGAFVGEPITVPLVDCIPLCADCCEELEESEFEAPGECHNPECFLCRAVV